MGGNDGNGEVKRLVAAFLPSFPPTTLLFVARWEGNGPKRVKGGKQRDLFVTASRENSNG